MIQTHIEKLLQIIFIIELNYFIAKILLKKIQKLICCAKSTTNWFLTFVNEVSQTRMI